MISVNMKNIAGVSGGGEDKRLKKNCEYILIYAKDYSLLPLFNGPYVYTEISDLVQQYAEEGKSWKYTSVLVEPGEKEYCGSTVDGDGNEIKVYLRKNPVMMSIKQVAARDGITENEAYQKYGISIFQTTNAQSSIRTRVMEYRNENSIAEDLISIEYVPRTGKNRGTVYEQFYKGDKCRLFVWLKDTSEVIDGELFKKDLQGTYWDMNAWMKNLTKEGSVEFGNGKKPEQLIRQIFEMTTKPGDWVLDSFLGSGTTAAVATKMARKWVGIELGDHAYTHCKVRLDRIVNGEDAGGITKAVNWEGGSGYHFYELAPSLLIKNERLPIYQINPEYTFDMLCEAICKIEGFKYKPDGVYHGYSSENRFIHITKEFVNGEYIRSIATTLGENQSLLIYSTKVQSDLRLPDNIEVKRIPKDLLDKCTFESEVR
jgi:adenine-specific DNA-methyltransferase